MIKLPYYLSQLIKENPLFNNDLFSRTFDMKLPYCEILQGIHFIICQEFAFL